MPKAYGSGYGKAPYGGGPWGGSTYENPGGTFESPLYPVPTGIPLCNISINKFSGENQNLIPNVNGAIFFSPALLTPEINNELDVAEIEISAISTDTYQRPQEKSSRVFTFGPNSSSRTNDFLFRSQPDEYTVIATLIQTIPPGPTTIIKIP